MRQFVFTVPERDLVRLDVAVGPCVPYPGRKRALAGPFRQNTGTADEIEALFRVLVPDAQGPAWSATRREGDGLLCVFSDEFVEPLAAFSRQFQGKESQASDEELEARLHEIAESWVTARGRPGNVLVAGLDVADAAWWARAARDRRQRLYAWFGPEVPLSAGTRRR
jgi:hypothetical protein